MASISKKAYLFVGLFVMIVSLAIVFVREDYEFYLFAAVGGIMFLYGLFGIMGKKEIERVEKNDKVATCPRCGYTITLYDNFCRVCGFKLR